MADRQVSGFHFNSQLRPHVLEHDGDRFDDQLVRIGLAVGDHLVLGFLSLASPCHVPAS